MPGQIAGKIRAFALENPVNAATIACIQGGKSNVFHKRILQIEVNMKRHPMMQNNKGGFSLQYLNPPYRLKAGDQGKRQSRRESPLLKKEALHGKTGYRQYR
jgi:hypothetical protein